MAWHALSTLRSRDTSDWMKLTCESGFVWRSSSIICDALAWSRPIMYTRAASVLRTNARAVVSPIPLVPPTVQIQCQPNKSLLINRKGCKLSEFTEHSNQTWPIETSNTAVISIPYGSNRYHLFFFFFVGDLNHTVKAGAVASEELIIFMEVEQKKKKKKKERVISCHGMVRSFCIWLVEADSPNGSRWGFEFGRIMHMDDS